MTRSTHKAATPNHALQRTAPGVTLAAADHPAASDMVTYHDSQTQVLVGDHVEFKLGLFFWRGWQPGRIYYVPGISPKNSELEYNGLMWVAIHDARNCQSGHIVLPETSQLRKNVRFVRRADDSLNATPSDYYFGDEEPPNANARSA